MLPLPPPPPPNFIHLYESTNNRSFSQLCGYIIGHIYWGGDHISETDPAWILLAWTCPGLSVHDMKTMIIIQKKFFSYTWDCSTMDGSCSTLSLIAVVCRYIASIVSAWCETRHKIRKWLTIAGVYHTVTCQSIPALHRVPSYFLASSSHGWWRPIQPKWPCCNGIRSYRSWYCSNY